jgi:glucokinase
MPAAPLFLGLDIGGTKCAALVGSVDGQIVDRVQWPAQAARGPQAMIEELLLHARQLVERYPAVSGVGVSIGGPLDAERGIILSPPNLPGWDEIPLLQILEQNLRLPVRIEHDAAACCLAEYSWGAGIGTSRLIYLTCGTGFGAGVVIDGKIYRGASGQSLEIGHTRFRDDGPEAFGKVGSVEAFCAGASLGKLATWKFPHRWPQPPDAQDLAGLWQDGDPEATAVIEINAAAIGEVCANLADFLRPDLILLGSLAGHLGTPWLERVRSRFSIEILSTTTARVVPAALGPRLQDCSALVVAISAKA